MEEKAKKPKKGALANKLILAASAVLFLAGAALIVRQYVFIPGKYTPPPAGGTENTPVLTATPSPSPSGTPLPTPSPTPYRKPVPIKIYFTEREISTDIVPVQKDEDGRMDTVDSSSLAAWYELGPAPGEEGNALVNGHVRWKKVAGIFSILPGLWAGEEVVFEFQDGSIKAFAVEYITYFRFDDVSANQMMDMSGEARVTLISCYGEMNHEAHTSEQRVFVVLKPKAEAAYPATQIPLPSEAAAELP